MSSWDKITDKHIDQLHDLIKGLAYKGVKKLEDIGIYCRIYCSFRSFDEQNKLYARGRSQEYLDNKGIDVKARPDLKKVTWVTGGNSYHNYRLAFDCVEIKDGKANWSNYKEISEVFKSLGFEWGGDWKNKDKPHFQFSFGYKCKELKELLDNNGNLKI